MVDGRYQLDSASSELVHHIITHYIRFVARPRIIPHSEWSEQHSTPRGPARASRASPDHHRSQTRPPPVFVVVLAFVPKESPPVGAVLPNVNPGRAAPAPKEKETVVGAAVGAGAGARARAGVAAWLGLFACGGAWDGVFAGGVGGRRERISAG